MGTLLTLMFMGYNLWVPYIIGFKPSFFHGSGSILFFLGGRVGVKGVVWVGGSLE